MAECRAGDTPLSEPIRVNLLTHICVTRPQWVKGVLLTLITRVSMNSDKNNNHLYIHVINRDDKSITLILFHPSFIRMDSDLYTSITTDTNKHKNMNIYVISGLIWFPEHHMNYTPDRVLMWYLCRPTMPCQAPDQLTVFRWNSKFDQHLERCRLKHDQPIATKFCTHHASITVVTCTKCRCDRLNLI